MLIPNQNKLPILLFCQKNDRTAIAFVFLRMMKHRLFILLVILSACNSGTRDKKPSKELAAVPAEIKTLYQSIKQNPDSIGLRMRLVDALDSMGDYGKASSEMDSLLKKDSANFGLWFRKAQLQEHAKDTSGAIRSFSSAAKVYPSPDALLSLANLYAEKKDDRSLILCEQVAELRMGRTYQSHCDFIAGVYYARTGKTEKAIQLFNRCIANNYTYMEAYMEKGFIYYDNKQIKDALAVFQTVVTVKNNYPDGYYWLGKCWEASHDGAAAIENYEKALSLDNQLTEAAEAIKRIKTESGR